MAEAPVVAAMNHDHYLTVAQRGVTACTIPNTRPVYRNEEILSFFFPSVHVTMFVTVNIVVLQLQTAVQGSLLATGN